MVTMALSRIVSEIFNVEKCRDLEIVVRGHSRSLKVVPFYRPDVDHSMSSIIMPFDPAPMTFY